jgi:hypothetical protein
VPFALVEVRTIHITWRFLLFILPPQAATYWGPVPAHKSPVIDPSDDNDPEMVDAASKDIKERAHVFSSIGAFSLVYPAEEISEYCISRLGSVLLSKALGQGATDSPEVLSSIVLGNAGLIADWLRRQLTQGLSVPILKEWEIDEAAEDGNCQRALSLLQEAYDDTAAVEEQKGDIDYRVELAVRQVRTQLEEQLLAVAKSHGVQAAQQVVDAMTSQYGSRDQNTAPNADHSLWSVRKRTSSSNQVAEELSRREKDWGLALDKVKKPGPLSSRKTKQRHIANALQSLKGLRQAQLAETCRTSAIMGHI